MYLNMHMTDIQDIYLSQPNFKWKSLIKKILIFNTEKQISKDMLINYSMS